MARDDVRGRAAEEPKGGGKPEIAGAVAETRALMESYGRPHVIELRTDNPVPLPQLLFVPKGMTEIDLEHLLALYRERPRRRQGLARVDDLESLIAHANRFKFGHSVLYARVGEAPSIQAIYDYHEPTEAALAEEHNGARYLGHRARYDFPLSDEWKAWILNDGKMMSQADFAAFLEDRAMDLLPPPAALESKQPPGDFGDLTADERLAGILAQLKTRLATPGELLELSRELSILVEATIKTRTRLASGESQLVYEEVHRGEGGKTVEVPGAFLVGIPFFVLGRRYRLLARLRYRPAGTAGHVVFFYELHDVARSLEHAVRDSAGRVAEETGLPLLYGTPE